MQKGKCERASERANHIIFILRVRRQSLNDKVKYIQAVKLFSYCELSVTDVVTHLSKSNARIRISKLPIPFKKFRHATLSILTMKLGPI